MYKLFLTANSLWETPNHLKGYVEALIGQDATLYIPEEISSEESEKLEHAATLYAQNTALTIIRGEDAFLQNQEGLLFDFSPRPCTKKWLPPSGWRGKRTGLITLSQSKENTQSRLAEAEQALDCILIDRRWDEAFGAEDDILRFPHHKQFFLPSAWKTSTHHDEASNGQSTTSKETCALYDSSERHPSATTEDYPTKTLLPILKKSARITLIDGAYQENKSGDDNFPNKVLTKANALILAFEDPARLFAWALLAEQKNIPWIAWNPDKLSPMRLAAYGIQTNRVKKGRSIKQFLASKIALTKEGKQEHTADKAILDASIQELSASRVLEHCASFIQKKPLKRAASEYFFYELPQKAKESIISPKHWKKRSIEGTQTPLHCNWIHEYKTKELFEASCLKNKDLAIQSKFKRSFLSEFLFRETNDAWHRDFHQVITNWEDWEDQCTQAVENIYTKSKTTRNGYTQVAHGLLLSSFIQGENTANPEEILSWINRDKAQGRYKRSLPYEEIMTLAISGNYEKAEELIELAYENDTNAYDGFKVLGQVAQKYKSTEAALQYYQRDWHAKRNSEECSIQYILKKSRKSELKKNFALLERFSPRAPRIQRPITELATRYIQESITILGKLDSYPKTKKDCAYLLESLSEEPSVQSSAIQACLTGLIRNQDEGDNAFRELLKRNEHNTSIPSYWALMQGSLCDSSGMLSLFEQYAPTINGFLAFRGWIHSCNLAYDSDRRKELESTTQKIIYHLEQNLDTQETSAENFFLIAQGKLLAGQKEAAWDTINKIKLLGCDAYLMRFSCWLSWLGHLDLANTVATSSQEANYPSNHELLYTALAFSLLNNADLAAPSIEELLRRSPNYFEEQSEARIHHDFCGMLIAECTGNEPMAKALRLRAQKQDPLFEVKQKYWSSLKAISQKELQAISQ